MRSRWERLLEQKPIPLQEHLLEEVSKLFEADLRQWPPPIAEWDESTSQSLAAFSQPDAPRPTAIHFAEAFRLARWELERSFEAVDDYVRNSRWRERELADTDKTLLLFLSRYLVEQMLSLGEATEGRVTRRHMRDCLGRVEKRLSTPSVTQLSN